MQRKIELCKGECGEERPIVNRKYGLCNECNYKRINGVSRAEAYSERARERDARNAKASKRYGDGNIQGAKQVHSGKVWGKSGSKGKADLGSLKKKYSIKKISSAKKYKTSDGEALSQAEINRRLTEVKDRLQFEREPVCAGTGSNQWPLSWSHTISVARAKELGKAELCYDPDNLELEGYHERSSNPQAGHSIWEDGTWEQKVKLLNWGRKISYIYKHDREQYKKIREELKSRGLEAYSRVG